MKDFSLKKIRDDEFLNFKNVINLLIGSFLENSSQFQNGLKCKFNYNDLIFKINEINDIKTKKYGGIESILK